MVLRPGNAGADTVADHVAVLTDALAQIPASSTAKILVRVDGAGATHGLLEHRERGAVSIGERVAFRAGSAPADWRRTCLAPPFRALTWAESTVQRDRSRREAALSSVSRTSCSRCRTPASFQSHSSSDVIHGDVSAPERTSNSLPVCSPDATIILVSSLAAME
ncbi:hypothetical protein AQJ27_00150 [Streptomyces olivochromogenes]|uniref:IS1380 family transposase n=1 Tax=Streptomyces olivochromogenes TaxID=1963 RepID=A0A250V691_STROL|nr:hypothetical protein AQJ27_00150 [Streptomyces olivochromogenes]GAX49693.1 hypothetical protein SO3561_01182 [Streptomyces olivochromogenes]